MSYESFASQHSHLWTHVVTFLGQWQKGFNKHTATQNQTRKGRLQLPQGTGGALVVLSLLGGRLCSAASLAQVQGTSSPFSVLLVRGRGQEAVWNSEISPQYLTFPHPNTGTKSTDDQSKSWCDSVHKQWERGSRRSWIPPLHSIFHTDLPTPHFFCGLSAKKTTLLYHQADT